MFPIKQLNKIPGDNLKWELSKDLSPKYVTVLGNYALDSFIKEQSLLKEKDIIKLSKLLEETSKFLGKSEHEIIPNDFFKMNFEEMKSCFSQGDLILIKKFFMFLQTRYSITENLKFEFRKVFFPSKTKTVLPSNPLLDDFLKELSIKGIKDLSTQSQQTKLFLKFVCKEKGLPEDGWTNLQSQDFTEHIVRQYHNKLILFKDFKR